MTASGMPEEIVRSRRLVHISVGVMPFAAMLFAWWGQKIVDQGDNLSLGVVSYLVAAALFLAGVWGIPIERAAERIKPRLETRLRVPFLAIALVLTPAVFVESSDNLFRPLGVLVWVASILLFLAGLPHSRRWDRAFFVPRDVASSKGLTFRWDILALLAITLVGAFYRFYRLDGILAEMGTDLPLKYGNIEQVLKGNYMVFFTSFPGREPLFFYFASIFAKVFGLSFLTIKFSAAVVGTITIPALFITARRLFNTEVGLYAALLLAINHWHITLSRIGYRAILLPLFVFVLLYLIARAMDRRRDWDFAFVGLWIGLGMYTYNSWLLSPIAFVVATLGLLVAHRDISIRVVARFVAIAAFGSFLVFLPLARFGIEHPESYFFRVATRITSQEQPLPADTIGVFADNLKRTLGMFNYRGDSVFVVNVPYLREMEFTTAVLFVLGTCFVLARWRRGYNIAALSIFLLMLMPSALSIAFPNEVPSSDRASGGVAMAFLFAGVPLAMLRQHLGQWLPFVRAGPVAVRIPVSSDHEVRVKGSFGFDTRWLVPAVGLLLLVGDARSSYQTYFVDYAFAQPYHNYPLSLELARALDDFAGNGPVFIKYLPYWYDGNALRAQLQRTPRTWANESDHFDTTMPPFQDFEGRFLYILHPDDKEALAFLEETFPGSTWVDHYDSLGDIQFVSFYGAK